MSKTENNLQEAFAGESQANRKYLAFAKQAERDGYSQAAKLFRAAAAAETSLRSAIDAHTMAKKNGTSTNGNIQLRQSRTAKPQNEQQARQKNGQS